MSWFRLDDKSWSHPKVVAAGNAAWGALCRLGAYASDHLTDGVIPSSIAQLIASIDEIEKLISVGLLERGDDASYVIHDYLERNPSGRDVRKIRKSRSEAGRAGAAKTNGKRAANDVASAAANSRQTERPNVAPTRSRPDPDPKEKIDRVRARRPSRINPAYRPSDRLLADYRARGFDPEAHVAEFVTYWQGIGKSRADWDATFRNRMETLIGQDRAAAWDGPAPDVAPVAVEGVVTDPAELARIRADIAGRLERARQNVFDFGDDDDSAPSRDVAGGRTRPDEKNDPEAVPTRAGAPGAIGGSR